jgi:hypothetical protein
MTILKMVEEVFHHQEQMVRLAEHCLKYEEDDGKAGFHVMFKLLNWKAFL